MEEAIKKQDDDADAEDAPKALLEKVASMARVMKQPLSARLSLNLLNAYYRKWTSSKSKPSA